MKGGSVVTFWEHGGIKENMDTTRREGEDFGEYVFRLSLARGSMTWHQFANILNEANGLDLSPDAYRQRVARQRQQTEPFRKAAMAEQNFRDERNAWQRQNREMARLTADLDRLEEYIKDTKAGLFRVEPPRIKTTEHTLLIILSDWHIGLSFKNRFGTFDTKTAAKRLQDFIEQIQAIQKQYKCERAVVVGVGDLVNGNIRRSVQLQNRENLVEQTKTAAELLANFCQALCKIFPAVTLTGCAGNHTRLFESKENSLRDERLDNLIYWIAGKCLSENSHFEYVEPQDATYTSIKIYGKEVIGVHGDFDGFSRSGAQRIVSMTKRFPYAVCYGHFHSPAFSESDGILLIRGGCLCGTGDDYTVQKRLSGKPSQTAALFDRKGLKSIWPIFL